MYKMFTAGVILAVSLSSCTTVVQPDAIVPTVSYQQDIAPIIAANCAQSGCHGNERAEKFNLLSYNQLSRLVTANQPHNSQLYDVIRRYDGGEMPPKPNAPLTDVQIGQIYTWILQGATDN